MLPTWPLLLLLSTFAYAEGEPLRLTLEQCLDRLDGTPLQRAINAQGEIARAERKRFDSSLILPKLEVKILGAPVPDIGGTIESPITHSFFDFEDFVTHLGPLVVVDLDALQPVFTFGKLTKAKRLAELKQDYGLLGAAQARSELRLKTAKVFHGLQATFSLAEVAGEAKQRLLEARQHLVDLLEEEEESVEQRDVTKLDLYLLEIEAQLVEVRTRRTEAEAALLLLLDLPPNSRIEPDPLQLSRTAQVLPGRDELLTHGREHRSDFQALTLGLEASQLAEDVAQLDFLPEFFLGGKFRLARAPDRLDVGSPFLKDDTNFTHLGVALGLRQKLDFWTLTRSAQLASATAEKQRLELNLARAGLELDLASAYNRQQADRETLDLLERRVTLARQMFTEQFAEFQSGFSDFPIKDLAEAFQVYAEARVALFKRLLDENVSWFELRTKAALP
ncbi:MAG: hypothetical protein A2284_16105 [Deltaproteobacteria bacterium RIFOXYA12_FULL_61_11]|nr:MAG: hypothetical protein A2284_16105 [Deltaproteobacteria bacterium RIFOXYA12_FULL_61_11]